ncbi:hypothetical protein B0H10DRAFT_2242807 [Mycena sp. CBHHK59/15]|nr:hypothetical protein B0H10DRAFT_2242807 [Mycena sp. CBHHK59/15]
MPHTLLSASLHVFPPTIITITAAIPSPSLPGVFPMEADTEAMQGGISTVETEQALASNERVRKAYLSQGITAYLPAHLSPSPAVLPSRLRVDTTPGTTGYVSIRTLVRHLLSAHMHPLALPSPVGGSRSIQNLISDHAFHAPRVHVARAGMRAVHAASPTAHMCTSHATHAPNSPTTLPLFFLEWASTTQAQGALACTPEGEDVRWAPPRACDGTVSSG